VAEAMESAFIKLDRTTSVNNLVAMLHVQPLMTVVEPPAELIIPLVPKDPPLPEISIVPPDEMVSDEVSFPGSSPPELGDLPVPPPPPVDTGPGFLAFVEPPEMIRFVAPEYPPLARRAGFEGRVRVVVLVGEDGTVLDARIAGSEVSAAMDRAALDAARRCRFEPARQRTRPVKARVVIPFEFRLN
ncbi:MAG: energy transducer TonB, partial [bacterium]